MCPLQAGTFTASRSFRRQLGGVAVRSLAVPRPRLLMDNSDGNTEVRIALVALLTPALSPGLSPAPRKTVVAWKVRRTAGKPSE